MSIQQPEIGLMVGGKYRLLERIGSGGMSEVYRAENTAIRRTVAVKLLQPRQADDRELTQRLLAEAQTVGGIRHPAIVDMLDAGVDEAGPFIVMEYLVGASAGEVLGRETKLGIDAALATALPVLDALDAAHRTDVVHRDLKPENIFYSVSGVEALKVKLLDFGVAKVLTPTEGSPQTATGVVYGTPDYMSPEQAAGEPVVDHRSDLFSLGVVLYELLTGTRPFKGPSAIATAYKIAHARTPTLSENGGPAHQKLDAILQRALQKRPDERYSTAQEFAAELRTVGLDLQAGHEQLGRLVAGIQTSRSARSATGSSATSGSVPRQSWSSRPATRRPTPSSARSSAHGAARRRAARGALVGEAPPLRHEVLGKLHARGTVLRAIDEYVKANLGEQRRKEILARLPHDHSRDFVYGTLQSIVYYDLEALHAYLDAAGSELFPGNPAGWKQAGVAAVDGELGRLLRSALRSDEPSAVLRRISTSCRQFFQFGKWEQSEDGPRLATLRIREVDPLSLPLRQWLVGVVDAGMQHSTPPAHVVVSRGAVSFAPQLWLDVSW